MAIAGIACPPERWRMADLLEFQRNREPVGQRPPVAPDEWVDLEVANIPLRVRATAPAVGTALLSPLVEGEVLATVSRRDPRRHQAALWTSRNRVFVSSDPSRLIAAIRTLGSQGKAPDRVAEKVARVVRQERQEHGLVPGDAWPGR